MKYEEKWQAYTEHPEWGTLTPAEQQAVARKFAQKVVRREVDGRSPQMQAFIEKNVVGKSKAPSLGQAALEGAREGFDQSAVGMLANAATGRPQHAGPGAWQSLKDAASNMASGANTVPIPSVIGLSAQVARDPSVAHGVAGGVGSMVGQAPDIIAGGVATGAAAKGLMRAGVKSLPAAVAASVGVNAATGAGVTKAMGGTSSDAAKNAALMGTAGLLPFAKKVPVGLANPIVSAHPIRDTAAHMATQGLKIQPQSKPLLMLPAGAPPPKPAAPLPSHIQQAIDNTAAPFLEKPPAAPRIPAEALPVEALLPRTPRPLPPPPRPLTPADMLKRNFPDEASTMDLLGTIRNPSPHVRRAMSEFRRENTAPPPIPRGSANELEEALATVRRLFPLEKSGAITAEEAAALSVARARAQEIQSTNKGAALELADRTDMITVYRGGHGDNPLGNFGDEVFFTYDPQIAAHYASEAGAAGRVFQMEIPRSEAARYFRGQQQTPGGFAEVYAIPRAIAQGMKPTPHPVTQASQLKPMSLIEEFGPQNEALAAKVRQGAADADAQAGGGALRRLVSEEHGTFDPAALGRAGKKAGRAILDAAIRTGDAADYLRLHFEKPVLDAINEPYHRFVAGLSAKAAKKAGIPDPGTLGAWQDLVKHVPADHPFLDAPRKAFVSKFGVPPEVFDIVKEAERQVYANSLQARKVAERIGQQNPGVREAVDYIMSERPSPLNREVLDRNVARLVSQTPGAQMGEVAALAGEGSQAMSQMSRHLKNLDILTPETFQKHDGFYLPREYRKHFKGLADSLKGWSQGSKTIKGFFKRGTEVKMTRAELDELNQDWELVSQTATDAIVRNSQGATKVIDPKHIPDHLSDWEVTKELGRDTVMATRDYSLAEREAMGQMRDAKVAMLHAINSYTDMAKKGEIFAAIAKNKEFVRDVETPGFVLFPDARAQGTKAVKWGKIAGKWVREDVADYLKRFDADQATIQKWKQGLGINAWKAMMTLGSQTYQLNNLVLNVIPLELRGGSVFTLPRAVKHIVDESPFYQKMEAEGLVNQNRWGRELMQELNDYGIDTTHPFDAMLRLSKLPVDVVKGVATRLANFNDDMFRLALAETKVDEGWSVKDAAEYAGDTFYDPTAVNSPAAQVGEFYNPFIKPVLYTFDTVPRFILSNPAKLLALMTYYEFVRYGMQAAAGMDHEKNQAREKVLPDYQKSGAPFGISEKLGGAFNYKSLQMPLRDSQGNIVNLNTATWDYMQALDPQEGAPTVFGLPMPKAAMPSGPLSVGAQALIGKDLYRNRDLRNKATGEDRTGEFLWTGLGPPILTRATDKLGNAIAGRESISGQKSDVPTAALSTMGLKVSGLDPKVRRKQISGQFGGMLSDIAASIGYHQQMRTRNPMDAAKHDAEIERLKARFREVNREQQDLLKALKTLSGREAKP